MNKKAAEQDLREIGIAIAGIELATWAVIKAIFVATPAAEVALREIYPAMLRGLSGGDAEEVKARVESHMRRWLSD